jgi:hypothetical protein
VNRAILARTHLVPVLGRRRLVDLTVHDVDAWLADRATMLSTDTVHRLHGILGRCFAGRMLMIMSSATSPCWRRTRPARLLAAAEADEAMRAYVVVSLLTVAGCQRSLKRKRSLVQNPVSPTSITPGQSQIPGCAERASGMSNWRRGTGGREPVWCSARRWAPHWTRRTPAARSVGWPRQPAWDAEAWTPRETACAGSSRVRRDCRVLPRGTRGRSVSLPLAGIALLEQRSLGGPQDDFGT